MSANPHTLMVHNQSFADALQSGFDRMAKTQHAADAFEEKYQIAAAGPEVLRLGAEAIYDRLIKLHEEGGLFRLSVQRLFEKVCDRFDANGVQILCPDSQEEEFLLCDLPAITIDRATGEAGPGVPINQADEIVMPFTPRLLVSVGSPDGARPISDDEVDSYNGLQARLARDCLIHGPAATFTAGDFTNWRS